SSSRFGCRWRRSLNLLCQKLLRLPLEALAQPPSQRRSLILLWLPLETLPQALALLEALAQPPLESLEMAGGGARSTSYRKLLAHRLPLEALAQPPSQSSLELAGGGARSTSFRELLALWLPLEALAQPALARWRRFLNLFLLLEALSTPFGELLGDGWRRCSLNLLQKACALAATGGARSTSFAKAPHRLPLEALAQPPSRSSSELAGGGACSTSFRELLALGCRWSARSTSLEMAGGGAQ
ncbi:unnamed protein product, partial [Effrenium voratum]